MHPPPVPRQEKVKLIGAFAGALALGLVVLLIVNQTNSNKNAIEKGCILLNNAILKSQAETERKGSPTAILIKVILDDASPARQAEFVAAVKREQQRGSPLLVPCKVLANDPGRIKAVPIHTTTVDRPPQVP